MDENKKYLIRYIKDSIVETLVEDYKMDIDQAKEALNLSWLNKRIDECPELFDHDHPSKWAKDIYEKYSDKIRAVEVY